MYGSTVPEASKLPVIFPMMQRSVHNHRESILLCCSLSASLAHRLTGCHNNPSPAPCLLEQNSGKSTTTATPLVTTPSRRILTNVQVLGVKIRVEKIRQNIVTTLLLWLFREIENQAVFFQLNYYWWKIFNIILNQYTHHSCLFIFNDPIFFQFCRNKIRPFLVKCPWWS